MIEQVATARSRWIALAAATWSLVFAAIHLAWAAGWYIGLDPVAARAAFARPAFLIYDLAVALACLVAVPVSLALGGFGDHRVPRRPLLAVAWAGTMLLCLRAVAGMGQALYEIVRGRFTFARLGVWEPWFYLGAVLFAANLWRYRRRLAGAAARSTS